MTNPAFSVLLPTHQRPDVVGLAIKSVLAQSESSLELLVVGDGCDEATREVVGGFRDPRVRFYDLPKAPGFGYANRNVALREARGSLVAFAADDDIWLPNHLATLARLVYDSGAAWVHSRPAWVDRSGHVLPYAVNLALPDELQHFLSTSNSLPASTVVHRRSLLDDVGYWPEDVTHSGDWHTWRAMVKACNGQIASTRTITTLHFRAAWRTTDRSVPKSFRTLSTLAQDAPWWPPALALDVRGVSEQAAAWRRLQTSGGRWADHVNTASDVALDRMAWAQVHPPSRLARTRTAEQTRLLRAAWRASTVRHHLRRLLRR